MPYIHNHFLTHITQLIFPFARFLHVQPFYVFFFFLSTFQFTFSDITSKFRLLLLYLFIWLFSLKSSKLFELQTNFGNKIIIQYNNWEILCRWQWKPRQLFGKTHYNILLYNFWWVSTLVKNDKRMEFKLVQFADNQLF